MREELLRLLLLVFVVAASNAVSVSTDAAPSGASSNNTDAATSNTTVTTSNPPVSVTPTVKEPEGFGPNNSTQNTGNKGLLNRSLYVAVGLSAVVIIYFAIRTIRTKRRKSKTKKYGVIHGGAGDLEMQPLEREDDEDEDLTVFDVNDRRNTK